MGIPGLTRLAIRNTLMRPYAALPIVLSLAVLAGTVYFVGVSSRGLLQAVESGVGRLGADVMVVPRGAGGAVVGALLGGGPSASYMTDSVVERIRSSTGVARASAQVYLRTLELACCSVTDALVIGFDPESDFTLVPWLRHGLGRDISEREVLVGGGLDSLVEARIPGDAIGTGRLGRLTLYGVVFDIAGVMEPTGIGFIDNSVYISDDGLGRLRAEAAPVDEAHGSVSLLPEGMVSAVLVEVEHGVDPAEVAIMIEYGNPDVEALVSGELVRNVGGRLMKGMRAAYATAAVLWGAVTLLMGLVYWQAVGLRERELGVMRALGARGRDIVLVLAMEALLTSLAGFVLGVAGAAVALNFAPGLVLDAGPGGMWTVWFVMAAACSVVGTGGVATVAAVCRAAWSDPHDAMKRL